MYDDEEPRSVVTERVFVIPLEMLIERVKGCVGKPQITGCESKRTVLLDLGC